MEEDQLIHALRHLNIGLGWETLATQWKVCIDDAKAIMGEYFDAVDDDDAIARILRIDDTDEYGYSYNADPLTEKNLQKVSDIIDMGRVSKKEHGSRIRIVKGRRKVAYGVGKLEIIMTETPQHWAFGVFSGFLALAAIF